MLEAALTRKIVKRMRERGAWAEKVHGGPHQARGIPDIVAVYRGHGMGLEVKVPGREGTLTNLQRAKLRHIRKAGGVSAMVTSVEEVDAIMDYIDSVYSRR